MLTLSGCLFTPSGQLVESREMRASEIRPTLWLPFQMLVCLRCATQYPASFQLAANSRNLITSSESNLFASLWTTFGSLWSMCLPHNASFISPASSQTGERIIGDRKKHNSSDNSFSVEIFHCEDAFASPICWTCICNLNNWILSVTLRICWKILRRRQKKRLCFDRR